MSADSARPLPEWYMQGPSESAATPRESARIPVIWLAELFTPTTIPSLIGGVREFNSRQSDPGGSWDPDPRRARRPVTAESITSDRRRGYGGWRSLPTVRPEGSQLRDDEVADQMPAGIGYILLEVRTLTSTVTALTAQFGPDDDRGRELEGILNQENSVDAQIGVEQWRRSLRQDASGWLAERFPGSFHRLTPGQLPTIEFLVTGQLRPWDPEASHVYPEWAQVLDLRDRDGYLQCTTIPSLRLQEPYRVWFPGPAHALPERRYCLVLAAPEPEYIAEQKGTFGSWGTSGGPMPGKCSAAFCGAGWIFLIP